MKVQRVKFRASFLYSALCAIVAIIFVIVFQNCSGVEIPRANPESVKASQPDQTSTDLSSKSSTVLTISNCQLLKNGKPFYGMGVNYYTGLVNTAYLYRAKNTPPLSDLAFVEGLRKLGDHNIPFIRFGVLPVNLDDAKMLIDSPELLFAYMDPFVREAEKNGIGLIPDIFTSIATLPDIYKEPISAWGNPQSQTNIAAARVASLIALHYKEQPNIWIWEFTNEMNNFSNQTMPTNFAISKCSPNSVLCTPVARTAKDNFGDEDINVAFDNFKRAIRSGDPERLITQGNGLRASNAYNRMWTNHGNRISGNDNREEFYTGVAREYDLDDFVGLHVYADSMDEKSSTKHFDNQRPSKSGSKRLTVNEFIPEAVYAASRLCKPLFLGEFGPRNPATQDIEHRLPDTDYAEYLGLVDTIVANPVPLSSLWAYDTTSVYNATYENNLSRYLVAIDEANRKLEKKAAAVALSTRNVVVQSDSEPLTTGTQLDVSALTWMPVSEVRQGTPLWKTVGSNALYLRGAWLYAGYSYHVTPNTVLHFDAKKFGDAEIFAIAFGSQPNEIESGKHFFQFNGVSPWKEKSFAYMRKTPFPIGAQMHISIPIGREFTGQISYIGLIVDDDRYFNFPNTHISDSAAEMRFSNIRFVEE